MPIMSFGDTLSSSFYLFYSLSLHLFISLRVLFSLCILLISFVK